MSARKTYRDNAAQIILNNPTPSKITTPNQPNTPHPGKTTMEEVEVALLAGEEVVGKLGEAVVMLGAKVG